MFAHMVNKPFWHISDFVSASYTFGSMKMSDFVLNNRHMREVLIFFFHSKKTAAEAHRELQKFYGDAALTKTTCRSWFRRFKDGDFDVDDLPREGRSKTFEDAELESLLDKDPCQTTEELASAIGVTRQAIFKRLHTSEMIKIQGIWDPYDLKPRGFERRFFACEQLLHRQKKEGFLHHIVKRNHYWGTVLNAIDAFKPSTARKTPTIRAEAQKSDSTAWQGLASRCQTH